MFKIYLILSSFLGAWCISAQEINPYITQNGAVNFVSNAPLEIIKASSDKLQGVIDPGNNTFAFRMEIRSFNGFNSSMQQDHFIENYMEGERFPTASFIGKIIEDVDLNVDGEYSIRAKGRLDLHGVTRERIIKSTVKVANGKIQVSSKFSVLLEEHDISVPKIVYQKIAEEIVVSIEAELTKQHK
ncbi:MAG: YceI family protein [Saprospiraceae bacterium]